MTRKKRARIIAALLIVAVCVAIGSLWVWQAFRPTGIEALEKSVGVPSTSAKAPATIVGASVQQPTPKTNGLMDAFTAPFGAPPEGEPEYGVFLLGGAVQRRQNVRDQPADGGGDVAMSSENEGLEEMRKGLRFTVRDGARVWSHVLRRIPEGRREQLRKALNLGLDGEELKLLDLPDSSLEDASQDTPRNIQLIAEMCVVRHVIRGEEREAIAMIDRWGALLRQNGNAEDWSQTSPPMSLVATLSMFDETSEPEKDAVEKALQDSIAKTREDVDRISVSKALRAGRELKRRANGESIGNQNAFHFMMDGKMETVARNALYPVFDNQVDALVVAWASKDVAGVDSARANIERSLRLMNFYDRGIDHGFHSRKSYVSGDDEEDDSDEVLRWEFTHDIADDFNSSIAAALRATERLFHRAGAAPVGGDWRIEEIPPLHTFRYEESPFLDAVQKYYKAHNNTEPQNASDLRGQDGVTEENIKAWEQEFFDEPARPAFWRPLALVGGEQREDIAWPIYPISAEEWRYFFRKPEAAAAK